MKVTVKPLDEMDLKDALVLVAFPTTGAAAPIAAQYLIRHLSLPMVGYLHVPGLEHLMAVEDGRATSVVRIYGGEVACGLESGCPRVFIVTTEVQLPPPVIGAMAEALLEWAKAGDVHMILTLEGVVRETDDETPDVFTVAGSKETLKLLEISGAEPAGRALVAGVAAHLILGGAGSDIHIGALLVEARRDQPDGRAAAALIEALDKLLPDIRVDSGPLLEEAMELDNEIRKASSNAHELLPSRPPGMFV